MLGNKLLNIQFAEYHIWNNKSEGFPYMVLSTERFNQSVCTEYSEAVNARYTFQPLWVSAMINPKWRKLPLRVPRHARGRVLRGFSEDRRNRSFRPIYLTLQQHIYRVSRSPCFAHYEPHFCIFQPIYRTLQHIFTDTAHILFFNAFVTVVVPYSVTLRP